MFFVNSMLPSKSFVGVTLAGVVAAVVAPPFPAAAQVPGNVPFSRYEPILERAIFGAPPPPPSTNETASAEGEVPVEEPFVIPPGLDKVKVTLISRFRGIPAAGFTDGESNTPYYLLEGQSNDFQLVSVDFPAQTIRLRRGAFEADLPLWVNPATTNHADLASFGMPGGAASAAPAGVGGRVAAVPTVSSSRPAPAAPTAEELKRREEFRLRREEARKQREEERKKQAEELAKLTPEQRERRLHNLNVELIINDSGPPLPITLDAQDMQKLSDAGFDVPGHTPAEKNVPAK